MRPTLFKIGPLPVHGYGLMLAIAFLVAIYVAARRAKKEGIPSQAMFDIGLLLLVSSVVGARLFHIVQHPGSIGSFADFVGIWQGGLSGLAFYGGFMMALAVGILYMRWRRLPVGKCVDILAPSLLLGVGIGRIGCFLAGCCFGKPTSLPWGITFPENSLPALEMGRIEKIHPTQIYSSISLFTLFIILIILRKHIKTTWMLFLLAVLMYSVHRFLIDFLRYYDPADERIGGLATSQVMSIIAGVAAIGGIIFLILRRRPDVGAVEPSGSKEDGE